MTDQEISRRLALAIGWSDADHDDPDVVIFLEWYKNEPECAVWFDEAWRTFDFRDPAVIWPIAERYNAFPRLNRSTMNTWFGVARTENAAYWMHMQAETAAKAVALAVIAAHEKGLLK